MVCNVFDLCGTEVCHVWAAVGSGVVPNKQIVNGQAFPV